MTNRYKQVMENIELAEEMRERILANVQSAGRAAQPNSAKIIRLSGLKKYIAAAACLIVLLIGAFALPSLLSPAQRGDTIPMAPTGEIEEAASLNELSQAVGFEVGDISGLPFTAEKTTYLSYWGTLAEIQYSGENQTACFRKSIGDEYISGDYTFYAETIQVPVGQTSVTLKGEPGKYVLAVWSKGGFSFSLQLSKGIAEDDWAKLITGIR